MRIGASPWNGDFSGGHVTRPGRQINPVSIIRARYWYEEAIRNGFAASGRRS
jgi:hypothetical protein